MTAIVNYIEIRVVFLYIYKISTELLEISTHLILTSSIVNHFSRSFVKLMRLFYEQFVKCRVTGAFSADLRCLFTFFSLSSKKQGPFIQWSSIKK